jgi:hypothetical protein
MQMQLTNATTNTSGNHDCKLKYESWMVKQKPIENSNH